MRNRIVAAKLARNQNYTIEKLDVSLKNASVGCHLTYKAYLVNKESTQGNNTYYVDAQDSSWKSCEEVNKTF